MTTIFPLSKEEKSEIRKRIFLHLDGWALIPTLITLKSNNILLLFDKKNKRSLKELSSICGANEGYLNVAFRLLASQGYINRTVDNNLDEIYLELNPTGKLAFSLAEYYTPFFELIKDLSVRPKNVISTKANLKDLQAAWNKMNDFQNTHQGELQERMSYHMEGILLGPMMIALGINNTFEKLNTTSELTTKSLNLTDGVFKLFIDLLKQTGYLKLIKGSYFFNAKGLYYAKRASSYGVTISYLPTFANLNTLLMGDPNELWKKNKEGHERHVYRYMNVWGSGGAHKTYFSKVDQIIIELFNQTIEKQPKGIIDVGCGDGTFIEHIFDVIYYQTKRGKLLKEHPLFIIGVDYNQKARVATRNTMESADIWAEVEFGDISKPESLNKMLMEKHAIQLGDLLNTRTFLDHNRIYQAPKKVELSCKSDGAFAFRGRRIPNNELFQNLSNHLKLWAPYLKKFGLLLVELHSISPSIAAKHIGKTLATPYDATHGYTDQYIIELPCFINAAKHAGLQAVKNYLFKFPDNEKPTVSIQLLKAV